MNAFWSPQIKACFYSYWQAQLGNIIVSAAKLNFPSIKFELEFMRFPVDNDFMVAWMISIKTTTEWIIQFLV